MNRLKEARAAYWMNTVSHELASRAQRENWNDEARRRKQTETTGTYFDEHPEEHARVSEFFRDYYSDPEKLSVMRQRSSISGTTNCIARKPCPLRGHIAKRIPNGTSNAPSA